MKPELPPMSDALLDPETLEQLFTDLAGCTEILSVVRKAGPQDYVEARSVSLEQARDELLTGAVRAVQVRYRYDGQEWSDTLMRTPRGIRLVRCLTPESD